jgi:hypothetical protein
MATKKQAQMIRAQVYSVAKIQGILNEATRVPDACKHVDGPKPPRWILGNRELIEAAVEDYRANDKQIVHMKDGTTRERKRRVDACCLVAGMASHPLTVKELNAANSGGVKSWMDETVKHLKKRFGKRLKGVCLHLDESHPHLHFFVVGDAQRLHPGMQNEIRGNTRIADPDERMTAHKAGLKKWLDEYHQEVASKFGLERTLNSKPAWRIRDRSVRAKIYELDKELSELKTKVQTSAVATAAVERLSAGRDAIYDSQQKHPVKLKY